MPIRREPFTSLPKHTVPAVVAAAFAVALVVACTAAAMSPSSLVMAVSAVLLVASDPGPAVADRTGLFEIFGYGGLLAGAVLVLRVVAAIARDGTT